MLTELSVRRAVVSVVISLLLLCAVMAQSKSKPQYVEPVFVWTYLDKCEIKQSQSVNIFSFVENPSPDMGRYYVLVVASNSTDTVLFESTMVVPPFETEAFTIPFTPPYPGHWRITLSAAVEEPKFYIFNYADLTVH